MYDRDDCGTNPAHVPGYLTQLGRIYGDLKGHVCRAVEPQTDSEGVHGHRAHVNIRPAPPTTDTGEHDRKICLKWLVVQSEGHSQDCTVRLRKRKI